MLSRTVRAGESIIIGRNVSLPIQQIRGNPVRITNAPRSGQDLRPELMINEKASALSGTSISLNRLQKQNKKFSLLLESLLVRQFKPRNPDEHVKSFPPI